MVIKFPKSTKAEQICAILSYWDPARARETDKWYPLFYNYEAEVLAPLIKKNSSIDTVGKKVKEVIDMKLELEGVEYRIDEENARRVGASMIAAIKNMR